MHSVPQERVADSLRQKKQPPRQVGLEVLENPGEICVLLRGQFSAVSELCSFLPMPELKLRPTPSYNFPPLPQAGSR